jgi:hypothetical protein
LETQFFYFTTLIQLPMAHLKITFLNFLNFLKEKSCHKTIMEEKDEPLLNF